MIPQTDNAAYTLEETTLSYSLVTQAHLANKRIWAWTVNDAQTMTRMTYMDVDGVITDRLAKLQQVQRRQQQHPAYALRLASFDGLWQLNH